MRHFEIVLPQNEVNISVLPQGGNIQSCDCQLSNQVKAVIDFVLNLEVKSIKILTSTLMNGGEKIGWIIRILLESLWCVQNMHLFTQVLCKPTKSRLSANTITCEAFEDVQSFTLVET